MGIKVREECQCRVVCSLYRDNKRWFDLVERETRYGG